MAHGPYLVRTVGFLKKNLNASLDLLSSVNPAPLFEQVFLCIYAAAVFIILIFSVFVFSLMCSSGYTCSSCKCLHAALTCIVQSIHYTHILFESLFTEGYPGTI